MSAIIYEDYISMFVSKDISQKRISTILKITVVVTGIISTLLIFALKNVNGIFPVFTGMYSATLGPTLGLYLLGVLIPMANSKGAFYGGLTGIIFAFFIFIQNQLHQSEALTAQFLKPVSTEGCVVPVAHNFTMTDLGDSMPFYLYRISFWFNSVMGCTVTIVVGVIISLLTKHDKAPVPKNLLCPLLHAYAKKQLMSSNEKTNVELSLLKSNNNVPNAFANTFGWFANSREKETSIGPPKFLQYSKGCTTRA